MSLVLALGGALLYGFGDFSGGYAAKRLPPWGVTAYSQTIGLAALVLGLVLFPAEAVIAADIAWGAGAGVGGVVGIGLLYRALAEGTMAVVSPITAATAAALPVIVDVTTGGELTFVAAVGVGLALAAILAMATERSAKRLNPRLLMMALVAGIGFAVFFIFISQTEEASGFWPLVGARAMTIPLALLLHRNLEPAVRPRIGAMRWVAVAGLFDSVANLLVTAALQRGPLGIVSVLSSLYPVVTALIAMVILRERLSSTQLGGVALAMTAVVLLVV